MTAAVLDLDRPYRASKERCVIHRVVLERSNELEMNKKTRIKHLVGKGASSSKVRTRMEKMAFTCK